MPSPAFLSSFLFIEAAWSHYGALAVLKSRSTLLCLLCYVNCVYPIPSLLLRLLDLWTSIFCHYKNEKSQTYLLSSNSCFVTGWEQAVELSLFLLLIILGLWSKHFWNREKRKLSHKYKSEFCAKNTALVSSTFYGFKICANWYSTWNLTTIHSALAILRQDLCILQNGLELTVVLLPQTPAHWDYRHAPSGSDFFYFFIHW